MSVIRCAYKHCPEFAAPMSGAKTEFCIDHGSDFLSALDGGILSVAKFYKMAGLISEVQA